MRRRPRLGVASGDPPHGFGRVISYSESVVSPVPKCDRGGREAAQTWEPASPYTAFCTSAAILRNSGRTRPSATGSASRRPNAKYTSR